MTDSQTKPPNHPSPNPAETPPIHLAGDTLAGSGQLVRLAIGLSALTRTSIVIDKVRAGRPNGGLKRQHLTALSFLRDATGSRVDGAVKGAQKFGMFYTAETQSRDEPENQGRMRTVPRSKPQIPKVEHDIEQESQGQQSNPAGHQHILNQQKGTEGLDLQPPLFHPRTLPCGTQVLEAYITQSSLGSIGLVFQALLPFLLYYPTSTLVIPAKRNSFGTPRLDIHITGGTNVPLSPSIDYLVHVLLPTLARIGLPPITAQVQKRGWSTGGTLSAGSVAFTVQPLRPGEALGGFELGGHYDSSGDYTRKSSVICENIKEEGRRDESRNKMESGCRKGRGTLESVLAVVIGPKESEAEFRTVLEPSVRKSLNGVDGVDGRLSSAGGDGHDAFSFSVTFEDSGNPGRMYLLLVATCSRGYKLGQDWLLDEMNRGGKGGEDLDEVVVRCVDRVAKNLRTELGTEGCVDEYAQDQLIVFQALSKGRSSVFAGRGVGKERDREPSMHTKTVRWVINKMLTVSYDDEGSCEGIGLIAGEKFVERRRRNLEEEKIKEK